MLPGSLNASDTTSSKKTEQQLNRACEACRISKVRCLANTVSGSSQCQRCAKAGRQCVFAPPARRRQRKRTDVRVAELEREVQQLHSLLQPNATTTVSPARTSEQESLDDEEDDEEEEDNESPEQHASAYTKSHEGVSLPAERNVPQWMCGPKQTAGRPQEELLKIDNDIIDRGVISMSQAEGLLNIYRNHIVHESPGVVIPNDWTAEQLRKRKPVLFHAVMAAASSSKGAVLSTRLHEEVVQLYARSIMINAEKSIQHIQALFITVTYNNPPNSPAQLQVYLFCNMAASLALELGLASKPRTHDQLPRRAIRLLKRISSAEELLENCRTILALYTLTAGFSMRLRRPSILLFNSWMEECQVLLQKSHTLEDRRIVACLKLQRIADEAYSAFGLDDASTSFTLSELRLRATLRIFDRRMQDWRKSIPAEIMTHTMMIEYHMNVLSMWEFAMDGGHFDAPDFRNRHLTLPSLDDDSTVQPETLLSRTSLQITATITCISAAHSVLDNFLLIPVAALQRLPSVLYVRTVYALITLLKADYAVGTDVEGMGAALESKTLEVDTYLQKVMSRTEQAVGEQGCRVPTHWLMVLKMKIKAWHDEHMQWRRDGGHLRRGKANNVVVPNQPRNVQDLLPGEEELPSRVSTILPSRDVQPSNQPQIAVHQQPQPLQAPQPPRPNLESVQQQPLPMFNVDTTYSWPMPATTSTNAAISSFDHDMTDFSTAFQNGDLYLWNDMGENYGGWIPNAQTDTSLYDIMQFGGAAM